MNAFQSMVRLVDRWQQRHRPTAFAFAVVKKFGDDRGGVLAALFAYYAFVTLFPALLLLVTVLGFVVNHNQDVEQRVLGSALRDFPIIGDQIRANIHSLRATNLGLAVGLVGLVWGSLGLAAQGQYTMAEVWNVPGVARPSIWVRLVRSLGLLAVLGTGVVASSVLAGLAASLGIAAGAFTVAGSLLANIAVFVLAFRLLTPASVPSDQLWLGAGLAGAAWTVLQTAGGLLVAHQLRDTTAVYGLFGVVLGLLSFLAFGGTLIVYAAELNVVRARALWPRSIVQPPLTDGDRHVLTEIAKQGRRRPEQHVQVDDDPPADVDGSAS